MAGTRTLVLEELCGIAQASFPESTLHCVWQISRFDPLLTVHLAHWPPIWSWTNHVCSGHGASHLPFDMRLPDLFTTWLSLVIWVPVQTSLCPGSPLWPPSRSTVQALATALPFFFFYGLHRAHHHLKSCCLFMCLSHPQQYWLLENQDNVSLVHYYMLSLLVKWLNFSK